MPGKDQKPKGRVHFRFFTPFDETPLPSSLVQILKHLNIVEVEIEKPTNSHRKEKT